MTEFYRMSVEDTLAEMNVDPAQGLTEAEVAERQSQHGKNALPKGEGTNWFQLIIGQFTELMVVILLIAAVISLFLGETVDVIVIMIIVILNAALGIYQEYRAEQALAALSALQVPLVTVRRKGEVTQINAEELVPGDIVLLEEGANIPADGRILNSVNIQVEEAALTGESASVTKHTDPLETDGAIAVADRENMVYMGTAVSYGRGEYVVTTTGLKTELGNIAALLMQVETGVTPLQRRLNSLGQTLAIGAGLVVFIVFVVGWLVRGIPADEMFLVAVSLAVAAVPEGLPALVTIGLSLGAARMVRRNALIRRLPAVETLGSVTTICSDKTGTLTKNEMTATHLALPGHDDVDVTGIGYTPAGDFVTESGAPLDPGSDDTVARFLKAMALSTNAHIERLDEGNRYNVVGDTTEGALVVAAQKVGWTREKLEVDMPRRAEFPFSSERKAMTTVHDVVSEEAKRLFPDTSVISITKGAPDRLIDWATKEHVPSGPATLSDDRRQGWQNEVDEMAKQGLRVLGIAWRALPEVPDEVGPELEQDLTLIGLVGIVDPARPEAKEAVEVAKRAGIRPMMITGDHALTAEAIARNLGIIDESQHAVTGNQLDQMSEAELKQTVKTTSAFARVSPEHKLRIVRTLKDEGEVVAMTGDGVNDAPALKQADIGVAMGITGTDVSKGASEMVLTDDNFASIVAAVEEGRTIYDNIKKFLKYLLSSNVGEILVMFSALLVGLKVPLIAIQILWINLVTDGLPAIALGFEETEEGVMDRPPRHVNESVFADGVGGHIVRIGILIAILTLGGFVYGFVAHDMEPFDQTLGLQDFSHEEIVNLVERSGLEVIDVLDVDSDALFIPTADIWESAWNEEMRVLFIEEANPFADLEAEELAALDAAALTQLARSPGILPDDWDTLDESERVEVVEALAEDTDAVHEAAFEEEASGGLLGAAERIPRTIAFTILAFTQMFEVMAIHAGDRSSFFKHGFGRNQLLMWAVLSTFALQLIVVYTPFMQGVFRTAPLSVTELLITAAAGSVVLVAVELEKLFLTRNKDDDAPLATDSAWRSAGD